MSAFLKEGNWATVVVASAVLVVGYMWYDAKEQREFIAAQKLVQEEAQRREEARPQEWFVVKNVFVPDHLEGENPLLVYARTVHKPFNATWNVDVHLLGEAETSVCTGSGNSTYTSTEVLPESGVELSWFIGKRCQLKPGNYTLHTTWEMRIPDYPPKVTTYISNSFLVLEKGSQKYLTPEQVEKLQ